MLKDPRLEARAETISKTLRCVVCQNENIDDSGAPLAADMRRLVRERVVAGDTDDQVRAYLVARYGNFVLLKPPLQPDTWLLWFGPAAVLLVAAAGFSAAYLRRRPAAEAPAPLSTDERRRLDALLADTPPGNTP
ncbi:MAG: cytochrome c-type biogenesis protein CcmH [Proteobacteria bacterium]|nr:cytochrome c-type biogenesis protein CcmH [Pseudomonadota bacterium]